MPRQFKIFSRCEGALAVEFALILPVLMLIVFAIIDFGDFMYIRHVMSDASREGARYGTRYVTVNNIRSLPGALSPSISTHVLVTCGYVNFLPSVPISTVIPSGEAMTAAIAGLAGKELVVTVNATKTWWLLGFSIPPIWHGIGPTRLHVSTTMTAE